MGAWQERNLAEVPQEAGEAVRRDGGGVVGGERMNADKAAVIVDVTVCGMDEAQSKAERLVETVKSAKTLAGELADLLGNLSVDVKG